MGQEPGVQQQVPTGEDLECNAVAQGAKMQPGWQCWDQLVT